MTDADAPVGIASSNVTAWITERVADLAPPLDFELIAGGHSNLTFRVSDTNGSQHVLRRPPLHQVLATAHDMGREHTVIAAMQASAVPVPPLVGLCTDPSVNERPFYVMDFVDGLVVRTAADAHPLGGEFKQAASRSLVETLVALHAVDIDEIGLGGLAKREHYVARQLKRWKRQVDEGATRVRPGIVAVHDHLASRIPEQRGAAVVHGDYRLDNCIVAAPDTPNAGEVVAVLDWELCTLGDPLVDLAGLLTYWSEPGEDTVLVDSPTTSPGFWNRQQVLAAYADLSGRPIGNIDYYLSLSAWKLACILEGVYARYVGGAMGDKVPAGGPEAFVSRIDALVATAEAAAEKVP